MAAQVDENQAGELGHVYSKEERLLCRILLLSERWKRTQECSQLANSGLTQNMTQVWSQDGLLRLT